MYLSVLLYLWCRQFHMTDSESERPAQASDVQTETFFMDTQVGSLRAAAQT